jgi:hypothetical protein
MDDYQPELWLQIFKKTYGLQVIFRLLLWWLPLCHRVGWYLLWLSGDLHSRTFDVYVVRDDKSTIPKISTLLHKCMQSRRGRMTKWRDITDSRRLINSSQGPECGTKGPKADDKFLYIYLTRYPFPIIIISKSQRLAWSSRYLVSIIQVLRTINSTNDKVGITHCTD